MDPVIGSALIGAGAQVAQGTGNLISDLIFNKQRKDLQERIFKREDTAVQRRAADLEAAGLSKNLAAGGGAQAGQAIALNAPKFEGDVVGAGARAASTAQQVIQSQADVNLQNANARKANAEASYLEDTLSGRTGATNAQSEYTVRGLSDMLSQLGEGTKQAMLKTETMEFEKTSAGARSIIDKVQSGIAKEYGMDMENARLVALKLANEVGRYNHDWASSKGMYSGQPNMLTSGIGTTLESLEAWVDQVIGPAASGVRGAASSAYAKAREALRAIGAELQKGFGPRSDDRSNKERLK